jgi:hypothetical protein
MTTQTITIADRTLRIRTTGSAARGYITAVVYRNGRVIAESDPHAFATQAAIDQAIRRATAALAA